MAVFLGDIAFVLEALLVGAGLIALDVGRRQAAPLIKAGAMVFIVVGILGALCTGYFWFTYQTQGAFATAYPSSMRGGMGMGSGMNMGGQGQMGGMMRGQMQNQMQDQMQGGQMQGDMQRQRDMMQERERQHMMDPDDMSMPQDDQDGN